MSVAAGRLVRLDDRAHRVDDVEEADPAGVERGDRLLVRGVEHGRVVAAGAADLLRERHGGERVVVERLERPARRGGPVERPADAAATRCGQSRPSEIGRRMSGGDACAIVEPSTNSTIECTIDCGCTTTSMRSYGTSKSRCASITSRPLFTSVAEFVVTTRPMSHVGCASASAGRDVGELGARAAAERAAGCGEHEPAHLVVGAGAQRLRDRGVLGVDGHDLARARRAGSRGRRRR